MNQSRQTQSNSKRKPYESLRSRHQTRRGALAVLAAVLLIPLLGMVALAVDYGYLLVVRTDLQRAADAAALAAVRDLIPDADGFQDFEKARSTVRTFAAANLSEGGNFEVLESDIEFGRYDPESVYSSVTLLDTGTFDTVRIRLHRNADANSPVSLFFARIFGILESDITVSSTAVLQKAIMLRPGADILPFAVPIDSWNQQAQGSSWSIYGDGRLEDDHGDTIPGNWGTIDIGPANNSTADLRDQILNGLSQQDLDALHDDGRIPSNEQIDSRVAFYAQADTGLSSGIKSAVTAIHGEVRLVPLYDSAMGNGNNTEFHVVAWGVVRVLDSNWKGAKNTHVTIRKSFIYDGDLLPQPDLSNESGLIEGAFTSPALVE